MDRQFTRNVAIAVCAIWAAGCGAAGAQDATNPAADADSASATLPSTMDGEIARAHMLRTKGNYAEAAKALAQLMLVAPDNPQVVGEYGKALTQEGRPQEAVPFLKRALELQANDWTVYSALGVAYDQIDDHAKARQEYEQALALRPGAPEVLNDYAVSRMLAGDLDGAQKLLAQASAADGSNEKIANNLALLASMKHPASAPEIARAPNLPVQHGGDRLVTAAPRALASAAPRVLMEKVPTDPLAGPVAPHHATAPKLAKSHSHKTEVAATKAAHKPVESTAPVRPPMLRTAADNQ